MGSEKVKLDERAFGLSQSLKNHHMYIYIIYI